MVLYYRDTIPLSQGQDKENHDDNVDSERKKELLLSGHNFLLPPSSLFASHPLVLSKLFNGLQRVRDVVLLQPFIFIITKPLPVNEKFAHSSSRLSFLQNPLKLRLSTSLHLHRPRGFLFSPQESIFASRNLDKRSTSELS
jgi:hypothetical protein